MMRGQGTLRAARLALLLAIFVVAGSGIAPPEAHAQTAKRLPIADYLVLRAGETYFLSPDDSPVLELENPAREGLIGIGVGFDYGSYWGAEFVAEFQETGLKSKPNGGEKAAEYAIWSFLAQLRGRLPLMDGRLVPYGVLGFGLAHGEQNDRNFLFAGGVPGNAPIPLNSEPQTAFVGVLGVGIEYFLTDRVALGIEAKHYSGLQLDLNFGGNDTETDFDSVSITAGLRLYLGKSKEQGGTQSYTSMDRDWRPYLQLRAGGASFADADAIAEAQFKNPMFMGGLAIGVNINRYLGFEIAGEGLPEVSLVETVINRPGRGDAVEFSAWTNIAQLRLKYPLWNDRFVPYVTAGAGLGFTEFNDRIVRAVDSGIDGPDDTKFVSAVGIGAEYFLFPNLAIGIEAKKILFFQTEVLVDGAPRTVDLDPLYFNLGLRFFF